MVEVLRTNDLVGLSWAEALLRAEGIGCLVADQHVSAVEGSIGVIPRRLLVLDDDAERARALLDAARPVDAGPHDG